MTLPIDRLYPVIALAVLAGVTLWLERVTQSDAPRTVAELREHPDFIGEGVRLISFDEEGKQHYELIADKVTHYPASDLTDLDMPRLRYDAQEGEVRVSAARGQSRAAGEEIHLAGDVHVIREGLTGAPDLTLTSPTLTVWPDDERAETSDPVVLTRGDSVARGNGMKADSLFGKLELIGDARVVMPPSSRTAP